MSHGGTSDAVGVILFGLGEMIMYDVLHVRDVEPTTSEIRAHEHVGAAVGKPIDGLLALPLVKSTVISRHREPLVGKIGCRARYAVPIIEEDDGAVTVEAAEQGSEHWELVFVGTVNDVHPNTIFVLRIVAEVDNLEANRRELRVDELVRGDIRS